MHKKPQTPTTASGFDRSPAELKQLLSQMAADPQQALILHTLQQQAADLVAGLVREVGAMIPDDGKNGARPQPQQQKSLADLKREARAREEASAHKAALAQALVLVLVLGTMLNHDNPGWNPMDPATHGESESGVLLALLQMGAASAAAKPMQP